MKVLPTMGSMYSGSLRGITASHNKGGLYFRGRTVPTNPNTGRQQLVRSIMNGLMQAWSEELSESQRQAWRDYAANVPVTDSLGQTMQLSGINWFVRANVPRIQANSDLAGASGFVRVDQAPAVFNTGPTILTVDSFEGDFTTPPGTVDLTATLDSEAVDNSLVLLYVAPPQTPGVRFYKGPYQLAAGTTVLSGTTAVNFAAIDLSMNDAWASDTVPVAGWDGLFVPLKMQVIAGDGRTGEIFQQLVQFTDVTP